MPDAIETFTESARQFCLWVESETHDLQTARCLLLALMQGIPRLSALDDPETGHEYPQRVHEDWKADFKRLSNFPFQYYRTVFSPCDFLDEEPPTLGDVHDDFADIYGEVWHGLQALDRGDEAYAVNHWRISYFQHWGRHASSAIYAMDDYYRS